MVFFVRITVNQSHLRPICKSTKFNPKIQRTIYLINFQQLRLHVPDFIRTVVVFQYKCDNFYHPEADGGISILDESLGIDWRIPTEHANLSEKDTKHPLLKDLDSPFKL